MQNYVASNGEHRTFHGGAGAGCRRSGRSGKALCLLMLRHPEQKSVPLPMPTPADIRIFWLTPMMISVLDYSKGIGHTALVTCGVRFEDGVFGYPCRHRSRVPDGWLTRFSDDRRTAR
jgi:hypothetical protein